MSNRVDRLNDLERRVIEIEEQLSIIRQYLQAEEVRKIMLNEEHKKTKKG